MLNPDSDVCDVKFNQVWKSKYSNERIRINGHVFQFLWDCINIKNNKKTQITEYELIESWTQVDVHQ